MKTVITLSSHVTGAGVIRSLGEKGVPLVVVYYNKWDMGYVSRYLTDKIKAPHPNKYENKFIDLLVECKRKYTGSILIPLDDETLVAVSRNRDILEKHYIIAFNKWETVRKIIYKKYTYRLAEEIDVHAPATFVPENIDEAEIYGRTVQYPCMVKPCQSHTYFDLFQKKMVKVQNCDQLLNEYKRAYKAGIEVMLQEYIPGDDSLGVNYNSYFWNNEPLVEFTAEKVRLCPPESGAPCVVISKNIPEVIESSRRILKALDYNGYSCIEYKKDSRDGIYKFMEVNGRHNRSMLLSVKCGINFPWIEYNHLGYGKYPASNAHNTFKKGIYWIDLTKDLAAFFQYRKNKYSLLKYLKPYFSKHIFAIHNFKDPLPFIKRCFDLLKRIIG